MQRLWVLLAGALLTSAVTAAEFEIANIIISDPWSRATPPVAETGAVYLTLRNQGAGDDRLLGAGTPLAERAELHTHLMQDGVMMMRPVDFIDVPAKTRVRLEPGGLHVMLIGLQKPLAAGERYPLTLNFARAGSVTVSVEVRALP